MSRVGFFDHWPLILIDLRTKEGVVGRSYLEPYLKQSVRYIVPAVEDLIAARVGAPVTPVTDFQAGRNSLNLIRYEGVAMIANAGIDMAAWDALAKAANMPIAVLLGGSTGFDRDSAERALVDGRADLIAFARSFLANPDLVTRMQSASTMNKPDESTFYTPGPKGYTDYQ